MQVTQIKTRRRAAFTLFEIMIVVAIIGLLAAVAIPNFKRANETASLNGIKQNLRLIDNTKDQWAAENRKLGAAEPTREDLAPYFKNGKFPKPVVEETYQIGAVNEPAQAILQQGDTLNGQAGPFTADGPIDSSP